MANTMIIDCNYIEGKIMMCVWGDTFEHKAALKDFGMAWNPNNDGSKVCDGMGFWCIEIPKAQNAMATMGTAAGMIKAVCTACGLAFPNKEVAVAGNKFESEIKAAF